MAEIQKSREYLQNKGYSPEQIDEIIRESQEHDDGDVQVHPPHEPSEAKNEPTGTGGADVQAAAGPGNPRPRSPQVDGPAPTREPSSGNAGGKEEAGVTRLFELLDAARYELFQDPFERAYVCVRDRDRRETWVINSPPFRKWLKNAYYGAHTAFPSKTALEDVIEGLEGKAQVGGVVRDVHVRVAGHGGNIYLDLGDSDRRVVEIRSGGWAVLTGDPPVYFRRPRGMEALPVPVEGGNLADLQNILNLKDRTNRMLAVAWLLGALQPGGPYPILVLYGQQGSAKSTTAQGLRSLIDPHTVPLRNLPRHDDALRLVAANNLVVAIDNVSDISPRHSDMLSRLATGAGFGDREFYQQADEYLFKAARPILINGIPSEMIKRRDLLDRCLLVRLEPIGDQRRRTERDVRAELDAARPRLLGALLSAAAEGLKNLPTTKLASMPRLADLAVWVEACAPALGWEPGEFVQLSFGQRGQHDAQVLGQWPVFEPLRDLLREESTGEEEPCMEMLVSTLWEKLTEKNPQAAKSWDWPKTATRLSSELRRNESSLLSIGIEVTWPSRTSGGQPVCVCRCVAPAPGATQAKSA
jgi:hypothetical protein